MNIIKKKKIQVLNKIIIFLFIIIIIYFIFYFKAHLIEKLKDDFIKLQKILNIRFSHIIKYKLKIATYCYCIKNGGRARLTSIMLQYFNKIKIFKLYLFTKKYKEDNEYEIPENIKRIFINKKNNLFKGIKKNKIDILIYQLNEIKEMKILNNFKKIKVIFYLHSCLFYWIYLNEYNNFKSIYKTLQNSKYVITLVPFENDYLFPKWGINSILMTNFLTYEYNSVIPSDLSTNTILMIGRGNDKLKRFELGIKAMQFIIKEMQNTEMKIIANIKYISNLEKLVKNLTLDNNIKFVGYSSQPEIYFKNSSLHIFPSVSESFGYVLCETKIFGIPNIVLGLDYISIIKGGTIIIYDESPKTISDESIKILKNKAYKKYLGKKARKSMKKFDNKYLSIRWIKLILSVHNGDNYYKKIRTKDKKLSKNISLKILKNQIRLLKIRKPEYFNITSTDFQNFTFLQNYKI